MLKKFLSLVMTAAVLLSVISVTPAYADVVSMTTNFCDLTGYNSANKAIIQLSQNVSGSTYDIPIEVWADGTYMLTISANAYGTQYPSQSQWDVYADNENLTQTLKQETDDDGKAVISPAGGQYVYTVTVDLKTDTDLRIAVKPRQDDGHYVLYGGYYSLRLIPEETKTSVTKNFSELDGYNTANKAIIQFSQNVSGSIYDIPIEVWADGTYELKINANPCDSPDDNHSHWDVYAGDEKVDMTRVLGSNGYGADENGQAVYTATVTLKKNTNLRIAVKPRQADGHYVLYGGYYSLTLKPDEEPETPVEQKGVITIEAESYDSLVNMTPTEVTATSLTGENNPADPSLASGGKLIAATASGVSRNPASITYKAEVKADGVYTMTLDSASLNNVKALSPIKLTVKQGDKTFMDKELLGIAGSTAYIYTYDAESNSVATEEKVFTALDANTRLKESTLYYSLFGGLAVHRYELINPFELTEGQLEITLTVDSGRDTGAVTDDGFVILDVIKLTRAADYSTIAVDADEFVQKSAENKQLKAVDGYGVEITSDEATLVWSSSNEYIMSVDSTGLLTIKNPGKSTITLTATVDGNTYTATKDIYAYDSSFGYVLYSATVKNKQVVVKYRTFGGSGNITLFAGRYTADDNTLAYCNYKDISLAAESEIQTAYIPLDSEDGSIRVFSWNGVDKLVPAFAATTVK